LTILFACAAYLPVSHLTGNALSVPERLAVGYLVSGLAVFLTVSAIGPYFLDIRTTYLAFGLLLSAAILSFRSLASDGHGWAMQVRAEWPRLNRSTKVVAGVVLVLAIISLLQGLAPPNTFDSLHYHLPVAKYDVEIGRVMPQWRAGQAFGFFPQFMGHQTRLYLILDPSGKLTQMMHGNLAVIAAVGAAGLARRAGMPAAGNWLAALMVLANRAVVWQSASAETDTALAGVTAMSVIVFLAWQERRGVSLSILLGMLLGIGVLVKYHGFAVGLAAAPLFLWGLIGRKQNAWVQTSVVGAVAALTMSPLLVRNYLLVDNPVFPLFNGLFNPDQQTFFLATASQFGTGRGFWDLVIAPWTLSIHATEHFDGMMFGAPYILALAPLAVLYRPPIKHWHTLLALITAYFIVWFYLLSQQVRFLVPILPLLAVFCAAGIMALFQESASRAAKFAATLPVTILLGLQLAFVGVYAALRLPPAVGLVTATDYLDGTPTMDGANYRVCRFVEENLKPGERYLSLLSVRFYCPLAQATFTDLGRGPRDWLMPTVTEVPKEEIADAFLNADFRYVVVQVERKPICRDSSESASNCISAKLGNSPVAAVMEPVLPNLEPLVIGPHAAVYDGRAITKALRGR
jgi:hypothetical protein